MPDQFQVDPAALTDAARQITGALAPIRDQPVPTSRNHPPACGHPALQAALSRLHTTWDVATRLLVARADANRQGLLAQAEDDLRTDTAVARGVTLHHPDLPV